MHESPTDQALLDKARTEGRIEEAQRILLDLGEELFGDVDEDVLAKVKAIRDLDRLEKIIRDLLEPSATTWDRHLDPLRRN